MKMHGGKLELANINGEFSATIELHIDPHNERTYQ